MSTESKVVDPLPPRKPLPAPGRLSPPILRDRLCRLKGLFSLVSIPHLREFRDGKVMSNHEPGQENSHLVLK